MKKTILIIIMGLFVSGMNAQIPDIASISMEQKLAVLKSLSESDKKLLLKELQKDMGSAGQPLEQPQVVFPSNANDKQNETALQYPTVNEEEDKSYLRAIRGECRYSYLQRRSQKSIENTEIIENEADYEPDLSDETLMFQEQYKEEKYIDECVVRKKLFRQRRDVKPFGYNLFEGIPSTFAPVTEIPVPLNYVLGPGDIIKIFTYGNASSDSSYVVGRDGVINIEGIGPLVVSGLSFSEARQVIAERFATQMIGVKTSVTMGELRSIRVFILGEANHSGSYTVSSLSTMTNALFVSGGIKEIGSLRNIQLKRNGRVVRTLDLYDLLLKGDTRNDARLHPGDVIFIPTVGPQVSVSGNVKRPAIYETKKEQNLQDFIQLAGGILPDAHLEDVKITRFEANRERKILNANYAIKSGQQTKIQAGDVINVGAVLEQIENSVSLTGHVKRESSLAYFPGMRVNDLIRGVGNLKEKVDLDYALIRRLKPPSNEIEVLSFNLGQALIQDSSSENIRLQVNDTVYIFELGRERTGMIQPLINELGQQSGNGVLFKQVSVGGRIKVAGNYPLESSMTVADLIRAGGGLSDAAYRLEAELTRDELDANFELQKRHIKIDLKRLLDGDYKADVILQSRDRLFIKEVPNWHENNTVELLGQVQFPGEYTIKPGETLGQVMQRAGGLSENAFPRGTLFIRQSLQEKERKYLLSLADNLEKDITLLSIEKDSAAVNLGQALLKQLREAKAIGRLVINLDSVMANVGDEFKDVNLQNGDKILVPEKTQEVTVVGEVQFPTSHLYNARHSRNSYLEQSGSFTSKADKKRVYVVRADGRVVNRESTAWFSQGDFAEIQAGDTIVVPLDADYVRPLTLWTSVTQILSQIGIFAASIKTVGLL